MPKSKDRNEVICTDTRRNLTAHVLQLRYRPFPWMAEVSGSPRTLGRGSETTTKLLRRSRPDRCGDSSIRLIRAGYEGFRLQ